MHKSSTDLPVFLQYENLEADINEEFDKHFNSAPWVAINEWMNEWMNVVSRNNFIIIGEHFVHSVLP